MLDKLPQSLRIGPFDIKLSIVPQISEQEEWGAFSLLSGIEIRADQPSPAFALDTVLHEINHAIYRNLALAPRNREEQVVSAFATAWTQVLIDNPALVDWIAGVVRGQRD